MLFIYVQLQWGSLCTCNMRQMPLYGKIYALGALLLYYLLLSTVAAFTHQVSISSWTCSAVPGLMNLDYQNVPAKRCQRLLLPLAS